MPQLSVMSRGLSPRKKEEGGDSKMLRAKKMLRRGVDQRDRVAGNERKRWIASSFIKIAKRGHKLGRRGPGTLRVAVVNSPAELQLEERGFT